MKICYFLQLSPLYWCLNKSRPCSDLSLTKSNACGTAVTDQDSSAQAAYHPGLIQSLDTLWWPGGDLAAIRKVFPTLYTLHGGRNACFPCSCLLLEVEDHHCFT